MDRLIEVKVNGNHLYKDNNLGGVQGEGNVTALRIEFDPGWDNFAKTITFWDARGENPVKRILTADLLEDVVHSTRVYIVLIPPEPLVESGWMSFVIDGYIDDKRQRTVEDKLKVKPASSAEDAGEPSDPTPSQAEQLQQQIENLLGDIREETAKAEAAAKRAEDAASGGGGGGSVSFEIDETLKYDSEGKLGVNMATEVEDKTLPITAAAVNVTVGNIEVLLQTI